MSVVVDINIARGSAHRHLEIHRISTPDLDAEGRRLLDEEGEYVVSCSNHFPGNEPREVRTATFRHVYRDDVTVLIAKAGEAIRDKYGHL